MRVVIDANVLASGIFWTGLPGAVLDLWAHGRLDVLVSAPILTEYNRVLISAERDRPSARKGTDLQSGRVAWRSWGGDRGRQPSK